LSYFIVVFIVDVRVAGSKGSLPLRAAKLLNLFELTKETVFFTSVIYVFFYIFRNFAPH